MRYAIGIVFAVLSVVALGTTDMLQRVLSIACILPVGMLVIPYSVSFGFNTRLASTVVNVSIVVSIFAMWGIVAFFG